MFYIKKVLKNAKSPFFKPSMTQNMDLKVNLHTQIVGYARNNKTSRLAQYLEGNDKGHRIYKNL